MTEATRKLWTTEGEAIFLGLALASPRRGGHAVLEGNCDVHHDDLLGSHVPDHDIRPVLAALICHDPVNGYGAGQDWDCFN